MLPPIPWDSAPTARARPRSALAESGQQDARRVEPIYLEASQKTTVWVLGNARRVWTHFAGTTFPCHGENCHQCANPKAQPATLCGYIPVLVPVAIPGDKKLWFGRVARITGHLLETLEGDIRGRAYVVSARKKGNVKCYDWQFSYTAEPPIPAFDPAEVMSHIWYPRQYPEPVFVEPVFSATPPPQVVPPKPVEEREDLTKLSIEQLRTNHANMSRAGLLRIAENFAAELQRRGLNVEHVEPKQSSTRKPPQRVEHDGPTEAGYSVDVLMNRGTASIVTGELLDTLPFDHPAKRNGRGGKGGVS